jgi:hypothetical protein
MDQMDIFANASRLKLRFATTVGQISVEDLWDLPLTSESKVNLNSIAKGLAKELRESSEDDFVGDKTVKTTTIELKFDIVKHIIDVRRAEAEAKKLATAKKAQNEKILAIIAKKQDESLEGKSVEELMSMLGE